MKSTERLELGDLLVSAAELASDFKTSDVEIAKLSRRGIMPRQAHPNDKRAHLYPYRECVRNYVAYLKGEEQAARH